MANQPEIPRVQLNTGHTVPAIGFGVGTAWFRSAGDEQKESSLARAVAESLSSGFRHLDEAEMYANEAITGDALASWLDENEHVSREELFITSKVISVDQGIESVCRHSLQALRCGYFDLYLIHAPFQRSGEPFGASLDDAWKQMEALVAAGLVRTIGVSNWRVSDLEQVIPTATITPAVNQVEYHPYLQQPTLYQFCQDHNILVQAYAPLASLTKFPDGPIDAAVAAAAAAHQVTPAQVLLRWQIDTGRVPITTTSKPERMAEYLQIFNFSLSAPEVEAISNAGTQAPRRVYWTNTALADCDDS